MLAGLVKLILILSPTISGLFLNIVFNMFQQCCFSAWAKQTVWKWCVEWVCSPFILGHLNFRQCCVKTTVAVFAQAALCCIQHSWRKDNAFMFNLMKLKTLSHLSQKFLFWNGLQIRQQIVWLIHYAANLRWLLLTKVWLSLSWKGDVWRVHSDHSGQSVIFCSLQLLACLLQVVCLMLCLQGVIETHWPS